MIYEKELSHRFRGRQGIFWILFWWGIFEGFSDLGGGVEDLLFGDAGGFVHGEDVFVGCFGGQGVRGGEDVATTIGGHVF